MLQPNSKPIAVCLLCLFLIKAAALSVLAQPPDSGSWMLQFHSGFEGELTIEPRDAQRPVIRGTDTSVPAPNDWTNHMNRGPIERFRLCYEQGDLSQREATIVEDPVNPNNRVLKHEIRDIHVKNRKCRIQCEMNPVNLKRFYYKYRFYLSEEWYTLKYWEDELHHVIENEFWSGTPWGDDYSFRLHTKIFKEKGAGEPLHFGVRAEIIDWPDNPKNGRWETLSRVNKTFDIPIEKWMTVEFYAKEGDDNNGRLYYAVTPEGEKKTVIFDLVTLTTNPHDPNPDGFQFVNMLKSYFQKDVINHLKREGKIYVIYWDDFELYVPPENYEPISGLTK